MYKTKRKIDAFKVLGKSGAGKKLVGVPTKYLTGEPIMVQVAEDNTAYKITGDPVKTETFTDKFGRGEYELAYFII